MEQFVSPTWTQRQWIVRLSSWCKQLFCSRTEGKALYAFIPEDPPFKAPFKAKCRGKTSASSIKTPGAVNKPIPAEHSPPPSSLPAPRGSQTSTISFCTASVSAPPSPEAHRKVGVCLEGRRDGSSPRSRNPRVGKGLQLPPGWDRG